MKNPAGSRGVFLLLCMVFDGLKGLLTDHMLDLACIFHSGLLADTKGHQHIGQNRMPLENGKGSFQTLGSKGKESFRIRGYIAACFKRPTARLTLGLE